jgi:hypothetical protein
MRHKTKKWMSFCARKSIQLLGFVFGEFFWKLAKKSRNYTRKKTISFHFFVKKENKY